jgi:hypothetical protein
VLGGGWTHTQSALLTNKINEIPVNQIDRDKKKKTNSFSSKEQEKEEYL